MWMEKKGVLCKVTSREIDPNFPPGRSGRVVTPQGSDFLSGRF